MNKHYRMSTIFFLSCCTTYAMELQRGDTSFERAIDSMDTYVLESMINGSTREQLQEYLDQTYAYHRRAAFNVHSVLKSCIDAKKRTLETFLEHKMHLNDDERTLNQLYDAFLHH